MLGWVLFALWGVLAVFLLLLIFVSFAATRRHKHPAFLASFSFHDTLAFFPPSRKPSPRRQFIRSISSSTRAEQEQESFRSLHSSNLQEKVVPVALVHPSPTRNSRSAGPELLLFLGHQQHPSSSPQTQSLSSSSSLAAGVLQFALPIQSTRSLVSISLLSHFI